MNVSVSNGKYTVVLPDKPDDRLHALRYGEPWRDCVGDNLIHGLAYELHDARCALRKVRHMLYQHASQEPVNLANAITIINKELEPI